MEQNERLKPYSLWIHISTTKYKNRGDSMTKKKSKEVVNTSKTLPKRDESFSVSKKTIKGRTTLNIDIKKERSQRATGMQHDLSCAKTITLVVTALVDSEMKSMKELEKESDQILEIMEELQPRDGFEGLLVSQMVLTHKQATYCIAMANLNKLTHIERYNNQAIKLMRLYSQQLETLDRYRRKGNQKMTVEHVHVHKGGQAIVGEVYQGGGASSEK
ncbi:MAG: hypothetical protein ABFS32_14505 [Bacteroidota bacterium]